MTKSVDLIVREVVAAHCGLEVGEVNPDDTLDDLGVDSLGLMELAFEIEQRVGFTVGPADLDEVLTVRQVAYCVRSLAEEGR
jgi:acyl carrier protein